MTPSRLVTAAATAALLGFCVAGCGTIVGTTATNLPRKQHQASSATADRTAIPRVTGAPLTLAPPAPGLPAWVRVKLTGKLPASGPSTGTVQELPAAAVTAATAQGLASALHLSGAAQRVTGGWRATGAGTLQIADGDGQHWTYLGVSLFRPCTGGIGGAAAGASAVAPRAAQPGPGNIACPVKPGQLEPADPLPGQPSGLGPPSTASAEVAAKPVLAAVGLAGAPLRTATIGSYTFVSADPVVAGLPTTGFATTVGVGAGDRIVQASGWLGHGVAAGGYPLISAQQAFNQMKALSHPTAHPPELMCPLNPEVLCGTLRPVGQISVTGAVYGLALSFSKGQPVLVPAWLFGISGNGLRVPETAISPH
jgi:hypothetical protein